METLGVPKITLKRMRELLSIDEFINSNQFEENDPVSLLLILSMHQREMIEYQNSIIHDMKDKQLLVLDYLKQLDNKYPKESLSDLIKELEDDYKNHTDNKNEAAHIQNSYSKQASNDGSAQKERDYQAMQEYQDIEHSYKQDPINIETKELSSNKFDSDKKQNENKIEIDQVLAKVAYGDEELKENHLLENPDTGDFTCNAITHTYNYRELSAILRDQQHTLTDFMYKLFLVSINFAKLRQAKSYPVFKLLLNRVRVNSCEVLYSTSLSCFRMRALLSYLELSADMDENSLISDHIPESAKKRLTTNNLRYQSYDPAYDHPPGIIGNENDEELNKFAMLTLKKIEINKPESASAVPKYLYRILSLLYTCYNKQEGTKITTGVGRSVTKCETRICRAMVLYSQGKRSKTALNDMIKELEQIEFAKNMNKKFFR